MQIRINIDCGTSKKNWTLNLALRRLVSSLQRMQGDFQYEDRILDIATALELIYSSGSEAISYKFRLRSGRFLEHNPDSRVRIREQMKRFYKERSTIVHGVRRTSNENLGKIVEEGLALARETIWRILKNSAIPDWDDFMLGK